MIWLFGLLFPIAILWFAARFVAERAVPFSKRLNDVLNTCQQEGIVSEQQRLQILSRAQRKTARSKIRGTTWLAIFAGIFVAAGILLIIAHNWEQIGPAVRVFGFAILFAVIGWIAIRLEERKSRFGIPFSLLWFAMPILGIGLYAQTFQLSGDPVRPFFVWAILTAPLAFLSQRHVLPVIHILLLVLVLFVGAYSPGNELSLVGRYSGNPPVGLWPWVGAILLMGLSVLESLMLLKKKHQRHIWGVILSWVVALVFGRTVFQVEAGGWLFVAATSAATLWLALGLFFRSSFPERIPSYLAVAACTYGMTFLWHETNLDYGRTSPYGVALICTLSAFALIFFALSKEQFSPEKKWHLFFKGLFIAPMVFAFCLTCPESTVAKWVAVLSNLVLFFGALGVMWHGSLLRSDIRINMGILVLTILLITRFFDVIGSLVKGGVGFILSGLFLGGVAYALGKTRKHLIDRDEKGDMV